jgi:hypothetical protein
MFMIAAALALPLKKLIPSRPFRLARDSEGLAASGNAAITAKLATADEVN